MSVDCQLRKFGYKTIVSKKSYTALGVEYNFDDCFILTLDKYLAGIVSNSMTNSQYKNIILFIEFADEKIDGSLFELFEKLDEFLGKVVQILSPQYAAVSGVVGSDDKLKVADLMTALGNLEAMNNSSLEYMNQTQILVKEAIDEAMKKALIFG